MTQGVVKYETIYYRLPLRRSRRFASRGRRRTVRHRVPGPLHEQGSVVLPSLHRGSFEGALAGPQ